MNVKFNKSTFYADETAVASITIDNSNCKINCEKVELELHMGMYLECPGKGDPEVMRYLKSLSTKTLTGPKAGEKAWEGTMEIDLGTIGHTWKGQKLKKNSRGDQIEIPIEE